MERKADAETGQHGFLFVGNHLCLDFLNTQLIEHGRRVDRLSHPRDLAAWLRRAGVSTAPAAARLVPREGARILLRAKALRAALRRMAEALATHREVPVSVAPAINRELREARNFQELARTAKRYELRSRSDEAAGGLLAPIAQSAAELLAGQGSSRVRRCGNPACILYFYDTTRSRTRRWCSMAGCGNRMKVAAHYHRRRKDWGLRKPNRAGISPFAAALLPVGMRTAPKRGNRCPERASLLTYLHPRE